MLNSRDRRRLLNWFDAKRRDLPWRYNRDPYRIWISEVMLQQTTVATVIPRFEQFLQRFPCVQALADASEEDVLKEWEGLGYYSRARNLHQAARCIVKDHGGVFPDDPDLAVTLPGVGPYILGAVLSQAFEVPMPIVEANTRRLYCRLYAQQVSLDSKEVQSWLWKVAEEMLPRQRIGDFNQALMELGSLICTPTQPKCEQCPLRNRCLAYQQNLQEQIPAKAQRATVEAVREVCLVVRKGDQFLQFRRPPKGRWANMWEFPKTECLPAEDLASAQKRLQQELKLSGLIGETVAEIPYTVTRFRIRLVCIDLPVRSTRCQLGSYAESRWVNAEQLLRLPTSTPQRKLRKALGLC